MSLTKRCSEADCLSRVLLSQASRQATVSLIFDVRHNMKIQSISFIFLFVCSLLSASPEAEKDFIERLKYFVAQKDAALISTICYQGESSLGSQWENNEILRAVALAGIESDPVFGVIPEFKKFFAEPTCIDGVYCILNSEPYSVVEITLNQAFKNDQFVSYILPVGLIEGKIYILGYKAIQ
jgi:hypothetical protein